MRKISSRVKAEAKPTSILDFAGVFNGTCPQKTVTASEMDEILLETAKAADDRTRDRAPVS